MSFIGVFWFSTKSLLSLIIIPTPALLPNPKMSTATPKTFLPASPACSSPLTAPYPTSFVIKFIIFPISVLELFDKGEFF
jgi:hypothetical protein